MVGIFKRSLLDEFVRQSQGKGIPIVWTDDQWDVFASGDFIGAVGPPGPPGATGPPGPQGDSGEQGLFWMGAWSNVIMYQVDDAVHHNGSAYIALVLNQNSEPPNGDWDLVVSKGDTGDAGSQGIQGIPGPPGPTGATGATGSPGPDGAQGENGETGPQGSSGPQGATGTAGNTGASGAMGSPGVDGDAGEDGVAGPPGPSGPTGATGVNGTSGVNGSPGLDGEDGDSQWVPPPSSILAMPGFPGGTSTFLRADRTFAAAGGGGSSATRVVVTAAFPVSRNKRVNVVDAAVGPTSKVMIWVSGIVDGQANAGDLVDLHAMRAVANTGSFDVDMDFLTPWAGSLSLDYTVFA